MPGAWAASAPRCPQPGQGTHLRTCARFRKAPNAAVRPPRRRSMPTGGGAGHSPAPPAAPPDRLTWAPACGTASPRGLQLCGAEPAVRGSRRRACPEPPAAATAPSRPPAHATAPRTWRPGRCGAGAAGRLLSPSAPPPPAPGKSRQRRRGEGFGCAERGCRLTLVWASPTRSYWLSARDNSEAAL